MHKETMAEPLPPSMHGGEQEWPSAVGLFSGIGCVIVGQIVVIAYHYAHIHMSNRKIQRVQEGKEGEDSRKTFWVDCAGHLAQPEGFVMLGTYLSVTWMFRLMPASYYSWEGGVSLWHLFLQLVSIDFFQTVAHMCEHKLSPEIYKRSHKPHHRFLNPKMFDAFNGSICDTFFMILMPLFITANLVHANVWSYMAFGTVYSSWLTLIHSELTHPWDGLFRKLGLGTAGDHHVHHRCFIHNYGHLFMWWDMMAGTYKSPFDVSSFNKDI